MPGDPAPGEPLAVAHVVREWLPRSETFVHALVAHQRRVRPVVLTDEVTARDAFPVDELVDLKVAHGGPRRRLQRLRTRARGFSSAWQERVTAASRARGCRVLHAHFGPVGFRCLEPSRALDVPLVTTFYGFDLALPEQDPGWSPQYAELFARAAALVVEGPHMAEHLRRLGAPAERVHLIRIGVDLARLPFAEPRAGERLRAVQAARLTPKKGVDLTIRAFAAVADELPDAELSLVGDGPQRAELEELARGLGVGDRVHFLGALGYDRYRQITAQADVCVQPSRTAPDGDTEGGAPVVLIEMQAMGVAVVGTRHADIPDVCAHGDALVDEEDVDGLAAALVAEARRPPGERVARARAARERVAERHDAARQARAVEDLYLSLAGR